MQEPARASAKLFGNRFCRVLREASSLVRRLGNGGRPQPRRNSDDDGEGGDGGKDTVDEMDRGNDSEGNEWKMGYVYSDDYSDLDSEGAPMQVSRESGGGKFSYRFRE